MIPETIIIEDDNSEGIVISPTLTYRVDFLSGRILGMVSGEDAFMQAVHKSLSTIRYAHEIYDGRYGQELNDLIKKGYDYVVTELPRLINECLSQDDRVISTGDYSFAKTKLDSMVASFTVNSVYGQHKVVQEVQL